MLTFKVTVFTLLLLLTNKIKWSKMNVILIIIIPTQTVRPQDVAQSSRHSYSDVDKATCLLASVKPTDAS